LQFETAIRQFDLIGTWVPMDDPRPSSILASRSKWIGATWAAIDKDMVLSIVPSKTERTTRARVRIDLKLCPLVMECITAIPVGERTGPLIVNDKTGRPFAHLVFQGLWRRVRKEAGLSPKLWNRDIRAGGLTEASMAGASSDDRAKLAAHSKRMTREVYDRDTLISANRVAAAIAKFREKNEP
jgi:hypothetical protein